MYRKSRSGWGKYLEFIIIDLICLQISFVVSYMIRHGWESPYLRTGYAQLAFVFTLVDFCVICFCDSYTGVLRRGYWQEFRVTVQHVSMVMGITLAYMFLIKSSGFYSRKALTLMWGMQIFLSHLACISMKRWVRCMMKRHQLYRSVLLITGKRKMEEILRQIEHDGYWFFSVSGMVVMDEDLTGTQVCGVPVVASADSIKEYIRTNVVDEVFINMPQEIALEEDLINQLLQAGVAVHVNIVRMNREMTNRVIERFGGYTVLTSSIRMASSRQFFLKRTMDICGGVVGVVLTGCLTAVIAPIVYMQSPGPIFFSQERVGKNGRRFRIYKFRSMHPDAEARKQELMEKNRVKDGMMFKLDHDPRIFPFGHFIRKHSLDEFPQFWNVLKGEMSLVGTRPPTTDEYAKYDLRHRSRLATKPGVTGLWQVSGRSEVVDFEEVVRLDNEYICKWNLGFDLRIICETVKVVLTGAGAK